MRLRTQCDILCVYLVKWSSNSNEKLIYTFHTVLGNLVNN